MTIRKMTPEQLQKLIHAKLHTHYDSKIPTMTFRNGSKIISEGFKLSKVQMLGEFADFILRDVAKINHMTFHIHKNIYNTIMSEEKRGTSETSADLLHGEYIIGDNPLIEIGLMVSSGNNMLGMYATHDENDYYMTLYDAEKVAMPCIDS